ncbi:MAG: GIY-YIG nuclease family protein [Novosphingobium sp.]|nr:GIY-YIG nuclease family protein [Novosphingobium sp.]
MPILSEATRRLALTPLLKRSLALTSVEFGEEVERVFTLEEIRAGAAEDGISAWLTGEVWSYPTNQPALYTITANNDATAAAILGAFPGGRNADHRGYVLSRANTRVAGSVTLYVGSSKNIRSRLKQHLWRAPARTYALNLSRWCPDGDGNLSVKAQPAYITTIDW